VKRYVAKELRRQIEGESVPFFARDLKAFRRWPARRRASFASAARRRWNAILDARAAARSARRILGSLGGAR
jgi:hypothetical protein